MTRLLTIVSVVAALGVTAAAPASAATSTAPGRVGGKMHLDDVNLGIITDKTPSITPKVWWSR